MITSTLFSLFYRTLLCAGLLCVMAQPVVAEEDLASRVQRLETEVQALKQSLAALQANTMQQPNSKINTTQTTELILQNWLFREVQVKFRTFHALDLVLYNGYDKTVREIEARLDFTDLMGEHVYSLRLPARIEIPPHAAVTDYGSATNKRLLGKGSVLEKITREHGRASLVLKYIVFDDGSRVEFDE